MHELGSFKYYKKFQKCAEYEIDHVFYLPLHSSNIVLDVDEDEISEVMWLSVPELKKAGCFRTGKVYGLACPFWIVVV